MKLEYALLADAATILPNGTFDVIAGGFDMVKGRTFPATKGSLVFIARLLVAPEECGREYEFIGELRSKDGGAIYPQFRGTFIPPLHARHPNRPNWFTVCLSAENITFPTPGDYSFCLSIGGNPFGEVTIEAVLEDRT